MSSLVPKCSNRIRHQVDQRLDAHKAKDKLDQANAGLKAWANDAEETVAGCKATFDANSKEARAGLSERHADAAMVAALGLVRSPRLPVTQIFPGARSIIEP
nr:hypothetical protein [Beijerinckiaceae bacterium]